MAVPTGEAVTLPFSTYSDSPTDTVPADPASVTLNLLNPDGTTTTAGWPVGGVVRDAVGVFHYTLTPAFAGHYEHHWAATGVVPDQALDGSFDVDAEYASNIVSVDDFALYLEDEGLNRKRAQFILDKAQRLCETIVKPLPDGADLVILDVAQRAFANPANPRGGSLGLYAQGQGPYSDVSPGTAAGGLYLTHANETKLRQLGGLGRSGAFTIDMLPATLPTLPPWDSGNDIAIIDLP